MVAGDVPLVVLADGWHRWGLLAAAVGGGLVAVIGVVARVEVDDVGVRAAPFGRRHPWSTITGFTVRHAGIGHVVTAHRRDRRPAGITPAISRDRAQALAERLAAEPAS